MSAPSKPILGVDVRAEGIWVTELRGSWPDAQILNAAFAPVPPTAFEGGKVVDKKVIGQILKDLIDSMHTNAADAILSIQENSIDVRVMEVPQVPDSELRMVIEGELAHYQIFANQATALDYMRMVPGEDSMKDSPQVLVVAAEKSAVETCTQLAEAAELNLMAVEPVLSGQYRAAMLTLGRQTEDALVVSIGETHAEIAIIGAGNIRLYRRAAIGSYRLVTTAKEGAFPASLGSWIHMQSNADNLTTADGTGTPIAVPEVLDREAVSSLTMEIRRSLEYYYSQSPKAQAIVQGILAIQHKDLQPLCEVLSQALSLRMDVATFPPTWITEPELAEKLRFPDSISYMGSAGVAMRSLIGIPDSIPEFSLIPRGRDDGRLQDVRRRLVFALAASIISLFLGIFVSFTLGMKATFVEGDLKQSKNVLLGLQRIKQTRLESILKETALQQSLGKRGYPIPRIMDSIDKSIAPNSGLVEVTVNGDGRIVLSGEASDEKSIIETLQLLKSNSFLEDTMLDSFGTTADAGKLSKLERFQVTTRLAGSHKPDVKTN